MRKFLLVLVFFCFAALQSLADEPKTDSAPDPSHRVMVVAPDAELMVGEESKGKVSPGSVLTFTKTNGAWLFVPARRAWIKSDFVVAIEKSEPHFSDVINQAPTATAYHHRGIARHALGFDELAMRDLDEAVKLGLKEPALFINRANVWHSLGNDRNALSDINQAIEADPDNALAFNNRSLIRASLGDMDGSLKDADEAIRLDPEYVDALNNRGVSLVKRGEFQAAIDDYTRAIELNSGFVEAYANRGYAAKRLGRFTEALSDYRQAVKLAPQSPQAFNDAAWLVATCPQEELRDGKLAVQYAKYACELTEYKNGEFIDTLAAAYAANGQFPEAVKSQQQALTLLPEAAHAGARERLTLYQSEQPFVEGK